MSKAIKDILANEKKFTEVAKVAFVIKIFNARTL